MKKKLFGVTVSTIIQIVLCILVAFTIWLFAKSIVNDVEVSEAFCNVYNYWLL